MTKKSKFKIDFKKLSETEIPEFKTHDDRKWNYPGIGYSTATGTFYIEEDEHVKIDDITFVEYRECKEVEYGRRGITRYGQYTRQDDMVEGKITKRLQAIVYYNGQLYTFGMRSWTARALLINPKESSQYHDPNYAAGYWPSVESEISTLKKETGADFPVYAFYTDLVTGKAVQNPYDRKKKMIPIEFDNVRMHEFDVVSKIEELYEQEELKEWRDEWMRSGIVGSASTDNNTPISDDGSELDDDFDPEEDGHELE